MRRVVEYSTFFFPQRVPEKDGHYWGFVREAERRGRKIVRLARQRVPRGGAAHPTALVPGKPGHTRGSYQLLFSLATWRIEKDKKESVGEKNCFSIRIFDFILSFDFPVWMWIDDTWLREIVGGGMEAGGWKTISHHVVAWYMVIDAIPAENDKQRRGGGVILVIQWA